MDRECLQLIASFLTAIGTIAVAVLAIWGEKVREVLASPKVSFFLRDQAASFTHTGDQKKRAYWHIDVVNHRKWSPVKNIRLLVTGIEKKGADGAFYHQPLPVPVQLTWSHPQFHELSPTVIARDVCDLGYLEQGADRFVPSLYIMPNNFRGFVIKGEAMRLAITAYADNYASTLPLVLEIAWDGEWGEDVGEMRRHLVVNQVQAGH
jgi:hypothetical protein